MKKAIQYFILFIILVAWGIILTNKESFRENVQQLTGINRPCAKPLKYAVGSVDPRFGLTKEQFLYDITQSEKVWEDPAGKDLFEYNADAELKINLIFDERQAQSNEADKLENNLDKLGQAHDSTVQEYNSLSTTYKQNRNTYNSHMTDYRSALKDYEKNVAYWNGKGGAPKDEFDKLKKQQNKLENMYSSLEKERQSLNALGSKTNQAAIMENQIVDTYNTSLNTYKSKFGTSREFEKGIFDGKNIYIYEFEGNSDLKMTIIHEMGHALGIDHLNDPKSIMYYLIGDQDLENPKLTDEDLGALKSVCRIK